MTEEHKYMFSFLSDTKLESFKAGKTCFILHIRMLFDPVRFVSVLPPLHIVLLMAATDTFVSEPTYVN